MKYFDTHTHTNIDKLIKDFDAILKQAKENELGFNIVGVDLNTSIIAIDQSYKDSSLYCTIGIHPNDILPESKIDETIYKLEQMYISNKSKVIAIGECGIDLFYGQTNLSDQIKWFEAQINLANKYNLPVMIHSRKSSKEIYDVIKNYPNTTFIIHCFCSNLEDLQMFQSLDCYISIPGIVTFKNAKELNECIQYLKLDKLLTETDAPYLAPEPERGTINNPNKLIYVNKYLSNKLNIPLEKFNNQLLENISKLFKINIK